MFDSPEKIGMTYNLERVEQVNSQAGIVQFYFFSSSLDNIICFYVLVICQSFVGQLVGMSRIFGDVPYAEQVNTLVKENYRYDLQVYASFLYILKCKARAPVTLVPKKKSIVCAIVSRTLHSWVPTMAWKVLTLVMFSSQNFFYNIRYINSLDIIMEH